MTELMNKTKENRLLNTTLGVIKNTFNVTEDSVTLVDQKETKG